MRFNRRLVLALAATFVVLFVLFVVGTSTYRQRSGAEDWKAHTYRVLLETSAMRNGLAEAQTNLRGFLLTKDEKLNTAYESFDRNFLRSLQITLDLVDDPHQTNRLQQIQKVYARWTVLAQRQIATKHAAASTPAAAAAQEATARALFEQGRVQADRIRELLDQTDAHERELLSQRIEAASVLRSRTEAIVFGGSILGFAVMGVLSFLLLSNVRALMSAGRLLQKENAERQHAENEVKKANATLVAQISQMEHRNHEIEILSSCGQLLQACQDTTEASQVLKQLVPRLFPSTCGGVYLFNASGNFLEPIVRWGHLVQTSADSGDAIRVETTSGTETATGTETANGEGEYYFAPDDCWALRCGQWHLFERGKQDLICRHVARPHPVNTLCVPMMAQGNLLGLLHLYASESASIDDALRRLASAAAEQISLAIANLQLRETLRHQSIRDPLTNLYNRRYLEEAFERELQRATRTQEPIGVMMMDIDHFKRFNDVYGHGAGDALLQAVGERLLSDFRSSDIACRYGGEELTLILPGSSKKESSRRAEELRGDIAAMQVRYQGQMLGPVTISIGVAAFPEDGEVAAELIKTADAALYRAKASGRNRVVTQGVSTPVAVPAGKE